jgi:hypothetical protein
MKHTLISAKPEIDRRTTLRWLMAAMTAGPLAACGESPSPFRWTAPQPLAGAGYGRDPNLLEPSAPWPLTLTGDQRFALAALTDLILPADGDAPAASAVGVPDFIDEWVSAPYPDQQKDRALIVPGLGWLDAEAKTRFGGTFGEIDAASRAAIADDVAYRDRVKPGLEQPAAFFARVRALTMGAWFTSAEGWRYLGYLGNTPAKGDYAGPPPEAIAHLRGVLAGMGLAAPSSVAG